MKSKEIKVTFQPSGRSVYVLPGTVLLEAAGRAGIIIQTPCGGRGTCGKCRVRIISGECTSPDVKQEFLQSDDDAEIRLACQTKVTGPLVVEVPRESLFETTDQILTHDTGAAVGVRPAVIKRFFKLDPPERRDSRSDVERLKAVIGDADISYGLLRILPGFFRSENWQGTAVLAGTRLIGIESGDTSESAFGAAIDLGTTTIVGTLFNIVTGEECGVASRMNPQVGYGDDVISRISLIRENSGALNELQQPVIRAINTIVSSLAEQANISTRRIYETVIVGNSTMQQICLGLDPSALGEVPFVQVFDSGFTVGASHLGIAVNPGAEVFFFPQIGGFVGGDTVAGMLAARLDTADAPVLLVDIGTNGEIVLAYDGHLLAASTAAGPAFEGAKIKQGMRATAGAIEKVVITEHVALNVIGNTRPVGLCGTALIDTAAGLLRQRIIDETGRILSREELPRDIPDSIRNRMVSADGETAFELVHARESASSEPICLWQQDIRELQLASGAIRAGINILMKRVGIETSDLGSVLLAGAFGNFIRRSNARRIGLLPQIGCNRIRFIGNAASLGAKLALLSADERQHALDIRNRTEHVDLSLDPDFQIEFGNAMMFPGGDVDVCPD